MRTIFKYQLSGPGCIDDLRLPSGAELLDAQFQGAAIVIWALVDTSNAPTLRRFAVFGTGHALKADEALRHIATVQRALLVWHVFEVFPSRPVVR